MMSLREIEMCVLDCLQDDVIEDVHAIMRMLNGADDERSWEYARGMPFSITEVQAALLRLMEKGLAAPFAELEPDFGKVRSIPILAVGNTIPWPKVWFHIESKGRTVLQEWWNEEGKNKYPLG